MIRICNDCVYNNDGFCQKTYNDDLDKIESCFEKIKDFELSFYYDEESKEYRVVAYLGSTGEIIKQSPISNKNVLQILERENKNIGDSLINKIIGNNKGVV